MPWLIIMMLMLLRMMVLAFCPLPAARIHLHATTTLRRHKVTHHVTLFRARDASIQPRVTSIPKLRLRTMEAVFFLTMPLIAMVTA